MVALWRVDHEDVDMVLVPQRNVDSGINQGLIDVSRSARMPVAHDTSSQVTPAPRFAPSNISPHLPLTVTPRPSIQHLPTSPSDSNPRPSFCSIQHLPTSPFDSNPPSLYPTSPHISL
ncbi:hypothetical protein RRG08_059161 [Elysia crispata]|uniref:Uncharacterized protein n=1 Tax=Elysia crispata TaxID=231223 RepID=A0AAE1B1B6_9GAST|nr:hypothetical protein RRG08_059161 [Elysia crispata]